MQTGKLRSFYIGACTGNFKVGTHPVLDVSGPASVLTDTAGDNYKGCLAHLAGECWAGSAVGDVYVNAPRVSRVPIGDPYSPGALGCQEEWVAEWTTKVLSNKMKRLF